MIEDIFNCIFYTCSKYISSNLYLWEAKTFTSERFGDCP